MRGAGKLLCVLTQHSLEGSDAGRQAEALERALHTLPSRFKAWGKRNPCRCGNLRHGVALLCGFVTPSLAAQGGQRLLPYFNISRDIPGFESSAFHSGKSIRCLERETAPNGHPGLFSSVQRSSVERITCESLPLADA